MRWDIILWSFTTSLALALPSQEPSRPSRPSCIHMTPEKEQEIEVIVSKISGFINNLQMEHEHFDISRIQLAIEQHTADEEEEKETMLQLSINDCQLSDDELDEIDHHREMAKIAANAKNAKKNFDVMYLDLAKNGQKLLEVLDKKGHGPRLVYVEKDEGQLNYMFLMKKK